MISASRKRALRPWRFSNRPVTVPRRIPPILAMNPVVAAAFRVKFGQNLPKSRLSAKKRGRGHFFLAFAPRGPIYRLAQIARACGRVSVGRGSGQEAGEPPEKQTGSRRRTGEPRLNGGSRLKATTDRAFSSLSANPTAGVPKRLVFLAGRAERESPFQSKAAEPPGWLTPSMSFGVHGAAPDRMASRVSRGSERSRTAFVKIASRLQRANADG
jgi:hypothetical protein